MRKVLFKVPRQIRFLIAGGFNTFLAYLIYILFCKILGAEAYQTALVLSWSISSIISFSIQKYFVFQSDGSWISEYLKCCMSWIFSYLINSVLLEFFVKFLNLNIYPAQILATGITAIFTYCCLKKYVFSVNFVAEQREFLDGITLASETIKDKN